MKIRTTAIVSSLLLAVVAGCDSQSSSSTSSLGATLSGVAAGRTVLAGASITVLDADSNVVWSGTTDDSGRYEANLPEGVKFPVEIVAAKDTLELKTLAPWEDDGDIVSNVNPVTDIAFEKLEKHHGLDSIRTRDEWLRKGDSVFSSLADSLVEFEDFAIDPDFRGAHHQDSLLRKLADAADSAREDGDSTELKDIEDMVSDLSSRFEKDDHEEGVRDSLDVEIEQPADSLAIDGRDADSLRTPELKDSVKIEPVDTAKAVEPDSLLAP